MPKKIITVIGARPQIIKSSAISRAIRDQFQNELEEIVVHTGQHYDANMSDIFYNELELSKPNYLLNIGSASHAEQTAKMMVGLEEILLKENPDALLVYGDTNSTVAGALVAAKLHCPLIHIEAGLRSFNKAMPEEINRILCDHVSSFLFSPTLQGIDNLLREGFNLDNEFVNVNHPGVFHCGDIMLDNSLYFAEISGKKSTLLNSLDIEGEFALCTIHRPSNTDDAASLTSLFEALLAIQTTSKITFVLPLHPRTRKKMDELLSNELKNEIIKNTNLRLIDPVGFLDMIALQKNCSIVLTDSGGVQKEAYFFDKPCVILRDETEWVEIVQTGFAILAGNNKEQINAAFQDLRTKELSSRDPIFGNGQAAEFICKTLIQHL